MVLARSIFHTLITTTLVVLAIALLPSAGSISHQSTTRPTGDPCTSTQLEFSFGMFTVCTSKRSYRFAEAVDITLSLTASSDLAFKSMAVEVIRRESTIFSSQQLCLIPEGCLIKAGQTISATFFWTAGPPAGSYTARGTLFWDFPCSILVPPCLIISPPPAVAELTVAVNGGKS